jgi:transcriptional regulator with XRE-family HTH domain
MPWTIYCKPRHHAGMKASQVSKIFGRVLREQRLAMDLSQEALALAADVDRTFVSQMERGIRQPTLTTLVKLAGALNVSASTLISRTERSLH